MGQSVVFRLPILVYHKIDEIPAEARYSRNYVRPRQFDAQLGWLRRRGYESITFAQYLAHREGRGTLPRRPVLISFDDGYRSNLEIALPLLQTHGFGATIFVVSGLLGATNRWDPTEIQEPLLNALEIRAMARDGIEFESHTHTHPRLPDLSEQQALHELRESRERLAELLSRDVRVICYPFARHTNATKELAKQAGYTAGVTIRRRLNDDSTDLFALRRIPVTFERSLASFAWDFVRLRWNGD